MAMSTSYCDYNRRVGWENETSLSLGIEKFVVLTTYGVLQGSWGKEKDAIDFVKRKLKDMHNNNCRYVLLEAKKEIGTKTPEIEIEEIK